MAHTYEQFSARRQRLLATMAADGGGIAIVPTAPERTRNRDSEYLYRFDSYFYYLTGFTEPEALLILIADKAGSHKTILFCREKNIEREIWDGYRYGPDAAREAFGFDEAHSFSSLDEVLPKLIANQSILLYPAGHDAAFDTRAMGWLNAVRAQSRNGVTAPATLKDVRVLLDEMRLIKDANEIATLKRSATIGALGHLRAMRTTKPGMHEYEIEAELLYEFRRHGSQFPSYWPIVAGGTNACVLHYNKNDQPLHDGDLLLIDAGCELDGYASDITRTFPVNGKFSGPQKTIYELVLTAQTAAFDAVRPGNNWNAPHDAAVCVLAQGFIDLGLCKGSLNAVIESGDYRRFYMHRTGHWLGLDVHDAGEYKQNGGWRTLESGMVLTVEPGCYIRPDDSVPQEFWNIGIRIEDDVLVTAAGCDVISSEAPKSVAAIEELMRQ